MIDARRHPTCRLAFDIERPQPRPRPVFRATWQESHFAWRIRSVLWAGVLYVVTIPLWLLFFVPGWIAWCAISIWFLYRVVRGWLALNDRRPMPQ